jgi:phosphohistidine phosphatase SixA
MKNPGNTARRWRRVAGALLLVSASVAVAGDEHLWQLLADGGQVVLVRHATTDPGVGDPPGFRLEECATQRNLSTAGRDEARRIGKTLRRRGVPVSEVRSSRWCRCLETARLVFGWTKPWSVLDSLYDQPLRREAQTEALRHAVAERPRRGNLFLVTHQVNISALTGTGLRQGEMVVLTPRGDGNFDVAGRLSLTALLAP